MKHSGWTFFVQTFRPELAVKRLDEAIVRFTRASPELPAQANRLVEENAERIEALSVSNGLERLSIMAHGNGSTRGVDDGTMLPPAASRCRGGGFAPPTFDLSAKNYGLKAAIRR